MEINHAVESCWLLSQNKMKHTEKFLVNVRTGVPTFIKISQDTHIEECGIYVGVQNMLIEPKTKRRETLGLFLMFLVSVLVFRPYQQNEGKIHEFQ
jgi:hypothetical protein